MQKILYILTILCLTIGNSIGKDSRISSKDSLDSHQIAEYVKNGRNNLLKLIETNAQNLKSNAPQYNKYVFTLDPEPNPTGEYSKEFVSTDVADINALNVKLRILNGELRNGNLPEIYIGVNGKLGVATYLRRVLEVGEVGNAYEGVDKNSKNLGGVTAIVANYKKIFTDIVASIGVGAGKLQPNKNNGILVISLGHDQTIVPKKGITLTPTDDFSDKSKIETQIGCFSGYDDRLWTPSVPQGQPDPKAKLKAEVLDNFDRYPSSNSKNDVTTKLEIFAERIKDGLTNSLVPATVECPSSLSSLVLSTAQKRTAEFDKEVAAFARAIDNQNSLFITDNNGFVDSDDFLKYELPDKLQLLASGPDISEYKLNVIFHSVNFGLSEGAGNQTGDDFAQKVFAASSKLKSCSKCILIVVPYVSVTGTNGTESCTSPGGIFGRFSHGTAYLMPHAAGGSGVSFIGNIRSRLLSGNGYPDFAAAFKSAFTAIPKTHTVFNGIILMDHTFSTTIKKDNGYVTTSDKIFEVNIYEDSRRKQLIEVFDSYTSIACEDIQCNVSARESYENAVVFIQNSPQKWDVFKKTNLKESQLNYKLAEDYVKWYATREQDFLSVFEAPDDSKFYANKNEIQISDIILAIDIVDGVASLINLDLITSSIGAIYCYNKGRMEEFVIYTAAATVSLIPGPNAVKVGREAYQKIAIGVNKVTKTTKNFTIHVGEEFAGKYFPGVSNFLGAKLNSSAYTKAKSYQADDAFTKALEDGLLECEDCLVKLNQTPAKVDGYKTSRNTNPTQTLKQYLFGLGDFFIDNVYKPAYDWLKKAEGGALVAEGRNLRFGSNTGPIIAQVTNEGAVKFASNKYVDQIDASITKVLDGGDEVIILAPNGDQIKGGFGINTSTGVCYGGNCFIAGTPVLTINGLMPIENIELGSKVASKDPITGEVNFKEVVHLFKKSTRKLVKVYANGEVISTTPEHPFRVRNQWIVADRLKAGDKLEIFANDLVASNAPFLARSSIEIDSIVRLDSVAAVYNFEVEDFHTYFVGKTNYWVHNTCAPQAIRTLAHNGDRVAIDFLLSIKRNFTTAQRAKLYEALASLNSTQLSLFLRDFNHASSKGLIDDLKYLFGDTKNIVAINDWKSFNGISSYGQRERLVATFAKHLDFTVYAVEHARIYHLKKRVSIDENGRYYLFSKGVVGAHDETVFFSIPHEMTTSTPPLSGQKFYVETELGNGTYIKPNGDMNHNPSLKYVHIVSIKSLPVTDPKYIPGVKKVEYLTPAGDGRGAPIVLNGINHPNGFTSGALRTPTNRGTKTIYDPTVWPDHELDSAIEEAIIDFRLKGSSFTPGPLKAQTKEGYDIIFHINSSTNSIESWYFDLQVP